MITPETLVFLLPLTSETIDWTASDSDQEAACARRSDILHYLQSDSIASGAHSADQPLCCIDGHSADVIDVATCVCLAVPQMSPLLQVSTPCLEAHLGKLSSRQAEL